MARDFDLRPLLEWINPASLDYNDWLAVGQALKYEGYEENVWDDWSRNDNRYVDGECQKKWNSFKEETGRVITGATITQLAKDNGWQPINRDNDQILDWNSSLEVDDLDRDYRLIDTDYIRGTKIQEPKHWNPIDQIKQFVNTLFKPGDYINYVTQAWPKTEKNGQTKWVPSGKGVYTQTAGDLIEALDNCNGDISNVFGDPNKDAGAWIRINPLDGEGVSNKNVAKYQYALVESDSLTLERQNELFRKLQLPIATLTYSAGKSLHALVKVEARNYPEYQERVHYLYTVLNKNGIEIDTQDKNPSRLSRLPGFVRGDDKQFLIDTNIGRANWDDWKDYIEDLNDNLPDIENLDDLFDKPIQLAPELIHGVLRRGHKMLFAAPSKAGKSFGQMQLAIAIAEGTQWNGFQCEQGRVLYVNLEIDPNSAKKRIVDIYHALGIPHKHIDNIDMWNLRGKTTPMDKLTPKLIRRAQDKDYAAIIIDPIYKVLTGDENNAYDMAKFVNQFDRIATDLGCSVIYAHHFSKGAQGGKNSMERSSGSGVFSRDPDAIITATPLPVDENLRATHITDEECQLVVEEITKYNPEYQIPDDDLMNVNAMDHHLMSAFADMDNGQELLQKIATKRQEVIDQATMHTAWRLEGTLREFASFKPINYWFKYPIYEVDHKLDDVEIETPEELQEAFLKKGQQANREKHEQIEDELMTAFNVLSFDGTPVELSQMTNYLGIKEGALRKRIGRSKDFAIHNKKVAPKEIIEQQRTKYTNSQAGNDTWKKAVAKSNGAKQQQAQDELIKVYQEVAKLNQGAPVTIQQLVKTLGVSRTAVYNRIKKNNHFEVSDGDVIFRGNERS